MAVEHCFYSLLIMFRLTTLLRHWLAGAVKRFHDDVDRSVKAERLVGGAEVVID